jgi:hypothetical protein
MPMGDICSLVSHLTSEMTPLTSTPSLEDSRREREQEMNPIVVDIGPPKDYSIKEGEKIKVSIPKIASGFGDGRFFVSNS